MKKNYVNLTTTEFDVWKGINYIVFDIKEDFIRHIRKVIGDRQTDSMADRIRACNNLTVRDRPEATTIPTPEIPRFEEVDEPEPES